MRGFAANLTTLYPEYPFLDRFAAAARDGFRATEFLFPYDYPAHTLHSLLREHNLQQVLFNAPPGNWAAGERGIASLPDREEEFRASIHRALDYAQILECPRIHVMAGLVPQGIEQAALRETYLARLTWAAEQAALAGKDLLIEPISPISMPGYFLNRQADAHAIVAEIGAPNLKVQMDLYHCRLVEEDVELELKRYLDGPQPSNVGHIQIAGVPGRHEPDTGSMDFNPLFDLIERSGFDGWIGLEYFPLAGTSTGLGWLRNRETASTR